MNGLRQLLFRVVAVGLLLVAPAVADDPETYGEAPQPFSSAEDPIYPDIYAASAPRSAEVAEEIGRTLQDLKRSIERRGLGKTDLSFFGRNTEYNAPPSVVITTEEEGDKRKVETTVQLPLWPRRISDEVYKADVLVGTNLDMYREEVWELTLEPKGKGWAITDGDIVRQEWKKYRHGSIYWQRNVATEAFTITNDQLTIGISEGDEVHIGLISGELGRTFLVYLEGELTARLRPPTAVERGQMRRRYGEETFEEAMDHAALHFYPDDLTSQVGDWPIEVAPEKRSQRDVERRWATYFSNVGENEFEFANRFSPLFQNQGDFLAVFRMRNRERYFFYRFFADDPEWKEEVVFGIWQDPGFFGTDQAASAFASRVNVTENQALTLAISSAMMQEQDPVKNELLGSFVDNLADASVQPFAEPEFANFFIQISSGRPHWDEEQAFGRWRIPEISDKRLWTVWCQYEGPDDRKFLKEAEEQLTVSRLTRQDKRPLTVDHVKAAVTIDPVSGAVHMDTRIETTIKRDLNTVVFLLNDEIRVMSAVDEDGRTLFWEHDRGRLSLKPPYVVRAGEKRNFYLYLFDETKEIFDAAKSLSVVNWFPDMGYQNRKTSELLVQVPDRFQVAATGNLVSRYSDGKHNFFHYRADTPTLGPSFAYGPLRERVEIATDIPTVEGVARDGVKIATYTSDSARKVMIRAPAIYQRIFDPSIHGGLASSNFNNTIRDLDGSIQTIRFNQTFAAFKQNAPHLLEAYAELFGPYPYSHFSIIEPMFQAYSGFGFPSVLVVDPLLTIPDSFGTILTETGLLDQTYNNTFLAHEIARQWWGSQVTHPSYHDQWISIGLCQISAGWVSQSVYGDAVYENIVERWERGAKRVADDAPLWLGYRRLDLLNSYNLLYHKGGMFFHMLRTMLPVQRDGGEVAFKRILREIYERGRNTDDIEPGISTAELQELIEEVIGEETLKESYERPNLDWFFNQWVYGADYPELEFEVSHSEASSPHTVTITVRQTQDGEPFVLPAVFSFRMPKREWEYRRVIIDQPEETFTFTFDRRVKKAFFDRAHHIIADVKGISR